MNSETKKSQYIIVDREDLEQEGPCAVCEWLREAGREEKTEVLSRSNRDGSQIAEVKRAWHSQGR